MILLGASNGGSKNTEIIIERGNEKSFGGKRGVRLLLGVEGAMDSQSLRKKSWIRD